MDQPAFEQYVLDLLFVALKQLDQPVWEVTPVTSPLIEGLQPLFFQIAMEIFAMLLSANSPAPMEMDTERRRASYILTETKDPTPRSLVAGLSNLILSLDRKSVV